MNCEAMLLVRISFMVFPISMPLISVMSPVPKIILVMKPIMANETSSVPWIITNRLPAMTLDIRWVFGETFDIIISIPLVVFSSFTSAPII